MYLVRLISINRPTTSRFALICVVALLVGCSGALPRPQVAAVSGRVLHRGKPVSNAVVQFYCDNASRIAMGTTDSNGAFKLTTFELHDGAVVGLNKVTVARVILPPEAVALAESRRKETASDDTVDPVQASTSAMKSRVAAAKNSRPNPPSGLPNQPPPLPAKLAKPETTDLKFEVKAGEENTYEIVVLD